MTCDVYHTEKISQEHIVKTVHNQHCSEFRRLSGHMEALILVSVHLLSVSGNTYSIKQKGSSQESLHHHLKTAFQLSLSVKLPLNRFSNNA